MLNEKKVEIISPEGAKENFLTSKLPLLGSAFGVIFMPPPKNFAFPMQRAVT